jgi:hypothetical protein
MSLIAVLYKSTARSGLTERELRCILAKSRASNQANNLTGMLLYCPDNTFFQWLEGPEEAVHATVETIRRDPRHHDMTIIAEMPIRRREFANWTMGFNWVNENILSDYALRSEAAPVNQYVSPESAQSMFLSFGDWTDM